MARKKYIKDYRLVETVDERGRIRTDYEYIGTEHRFARGPETARRARRRVLIACGIGWLAFLGGLLPRSAASFTMYVTLPYLFTALPMGILTALLMPAEGWKEPLRRQQADRLENRYPPAALTWALLPLIALIGELVCLMRGEPAMTGGDILFAVFALCVSGAGVFAFSRRRDFASEAD